ncbi:MAG: APC family permease [Acidimicrobiales bacterium]
MKTGHVDTPVQPALSREVSLPMLILYGLGTTIGAGIYALTGEVAGEAGMRAPLSFLVSAALAGVTAFGFAELAGRLPRAAGEAVFVSHAFGRRALTASVGIAVLTAGVVAAATVTNAFGGYVAELVDVSRTLLVLGLIVALTGLAVSGAKESVTVAAALTVVEIVGLALVLWAGRDSLGDLVTRSGDLIGPPSSVGGWSAILGGAFLAFFAFLGFEDMDAIAEETVDAPVSLPRAILITLGITTVIYMTVAGVAVLQVDPQRLAQSDAPLALIYEEAGGNPDVLAFIAALAMVNGALVQIMMVPRVMYGLTNLGLLPASAGRISARTNTPARATIGAALLVAILAVSVELAWLARLTSAVTMAVFIAVNAALIDIKRQDGPTTTFQVPAWVPVLGIVASTGMFIAEIARLLDII